jgi:large subunit ribosomal protein L24
MQIRKDDLVVVIAGDDAEPGRARRVLRVLPKENRLVVEGVNRVYKHLKQKGRAQQGGRLSKEMPVNVSNVQLYCSTCKRGVRIARRYGADGHKERFCRKCGNSMGILSKPRPRYVRKPD